MKYLSIDCETTGTDKELDQILSIGIVIENTLNIKPIDELPSLHLVIIRDRLEGNVFALDMNRDIIKLLRDYQVSTEHQRKVIEVAHEVKFVREYEVVQEIFDFLYMHGLINPENNGFKGHSKNKDGVLIPLIGNHTKQTKITVAGKNFGTFDKIFLERLPRWNQAFQIKQRILDPAILFIDWLEDKELPNLNTCMQRAGIDGEVTHNAVSDSKDVIKVLRTKYEVVH